jgi:hypothetical protein
LIAARSHIPDQPALRIIMKKRTAKPLRLDTQTVRALTNDALKLIAGGFQSENTDQGCESPRR